MILQYTNTSEWLICILPTLFLDSMEAGECDYITANIRVSCKFTKSTRALLCKLYEGLGDITEAGYTEATPAACKMIEHWLQAILTLYIPLYITLCQYFSLHIIKVAQLINYQCSFTKLQTINWDNIESETIQHDQNI